VTLSVLDPGRTALLVIDMQNAFCHLEGTLGISGVDTGPAREVVPRIASLVQGCREAELPVIWTVQQHLTRDRARSRKRLPSHTERRARVSALAGSWDAQIVDELAPLADDPTFVVAKHRFGAFHQTRLEQLLRMLGSEALLVTGVTANACVETTIREAYLRDYDVVAVTDCIAPVRAEWYASALEVWAQYLAVLTTSGDVLAWLADAARPRPLELQHGILEVADLEAAEAFYMAILGFTVRSRERLPDGRSLLLTHEGLALAARGEGGAGRTGVLTFRVTGLKEMADRVRGAGHEVTGPGSTPYGLAVRVRDPDGNEIELCEEGG
jgi:ureidoacrylate peracid hydrolase